MNLFTTPAAMRWRVFNWPGWARWTATLSFLALVNWMLLAPSAVFQDVHVWLAFQDKLAHGSIFLTLALLVRWSLPQGGGAELAGAGGLRLAAFAALALYAGSIEIFQPLLAGAGRRFEWLDLASNFSGVCAGWLLFARIAAAPPPPLSTFARG